MAEEYNYGDPIPGKYRNRLFEWEGGGYDGCFWEMNQGMVDEEGHWHPIYSSGCDGIDDREWYDGKIYSLKAGLGYDARPPSVQYDEKLRCAAKVVFGDQWWRHREDGVDPLRDPKVLEIVKEDKAKLEEYERVSREYAEERQHREDHLFMLALERERKEERPTEVGLLDNEHIKETCRVFCESYKGNVGMMTHCLDKLVEMGFDVWCTCSDCGEQFQTCDYPDFSSCIDRNAYTGDGGIGVIMKRVLCEDCESAVRCPTCCEPDCPNERAEDQENAWRMYDFLACLMYDWFGICYGCTDGFRDCLTWWDEDCRTRTPTELGEKVEWHIDRLKESHDCDDKELYDLLTKTVRGRKKINELRDMLQDAVKEHFKDSSDCYGICDRLECRLDVKEPEQNELPGLTDKKEVGNEG